jgi:AraC-like DNA-binding protein
MQNLPSDLAMLLNLSSPKEGLNELLIPGVHCIKFSQPTKYLKHRWWPSFGIVLQGYKELMMGRDVYRIQAGHYIATPIELQVTSRVRLVSSKQPFLSLIMRIDPLMLSDLSAQLEQDISPDIKNSVRAIFIGKASDAMMDVAIRLAKLIQAPEDATIIGPLAIKEMLYHLLKSEDGSIIRQSVRSGSIMHKISRAIYTLNSELNHDINIGALAEEANMSRSVFFKHFKKVTAMSPIQYQKRLRLLEARRLMIDEAKTAESSAFKVGYKSTSQFSREYTRMFGSSPLRDAKRLAILKSSHEVAI